MTRRQRRRRAAALDFGQAWNLLHALARAGFDDDRRLMITLARRCEETTTKRSLRAASRKWAETYAAGRSVKFKTYSVTILEPVSDDLVDEVESAFEK
jgi:hypothetical protein